MSKPVALFSRIGLPVHGYVTGGSIALPNGKSRTHLQPAGQMTRLVRGKTRQLLTFTQAQTTLDQENGNTWLDHANLSGTSLDIGGKSLGSDAFLYNDGDRTWLLRYSVLPSGFPGNIFPRYVTLTLEAEFGTMALEETAQINNDIYRETFANPGEDYTYISGATPYYTTMQTQDGGFLLINCHARIHVTSRDDQNDFLSLYPWLSYTVSLDEAFYDFAVGDHWHIIKLTGKGPNDIVATTYGRNFYTGSTYQECLKTLSHAGAIDMLEIDASHWLDSPDPYCELRRQSTGVVLKRFSLDYTNDQPNVGLKFLDGGLLDAFELHTGNAFRIHPHEMSVAPTVAGKTYDIDNDEWYPGTGCIV